MRLSKWIGQRFIFISVAACDEIPLLVATNDDDDLEKELGGLLAPLSVELRKNFEEAAVFVMFRELDSGSANGYVAFSPAAEVLCQNKEIIGYLLSRSILRC